MATNYIPEHLRAIVKTLSDFTYHNGFEISRVFDDWLTYIIFGFSPEAKPVDGWRYKKEHNLVFAQLLREWIELMNKRVCADGMWYDVFGDLYESLICSSSRASNAGQFFTPETVVNFMVQIQGDGKELTGKGLNVKDPTCGSGRLLVSFHAMAPGNFMFGQDIDQTCCLMTICNFIIHGVVGEVVWGNSLDHNSYYKGWKVNEHLNHPLHQFYGIPHVREIDKEESFIYQNNLREVESLKSQYTDKKSNKTNNIFPNNAPLMQLELF